ncbi:MAG: hypothetical protein MUC53_00100 [Candidatus Contendobacter sp.]|jgi:hypothetical protein|nr:hypothetical protein [Candidatus Contendobacter sp.]
MTTAATTALYALQDHLEKITTGNGYAVTVASVTTGRAALASPTAGTFPLIVLTILQDAPTDALLQPGQRFQSWNRSILLEAFTAESSDGTWDEELDTLWDAIRTALARYTGILSWGAVEFIAPQDGGNICLLRIPLTMPYSLIVE